METIDFEPGGYRFIKAVFQYSGGVCALPGYRMVRVQFHSPLPLAQGFERAEAIIGAAVRPLTSFAACELRSPAPFTEAGFRAFNEQYVSTLQRWGIYDGSINPVARSNVCPEIAPPKERLRLHGGGGRSRAVIRHVQQRRSPGGTRELS